MRGGIERYLRTFPSGGYWQGKNYLFDKRIAQVPEKKSLDQVEEEIVTGVVHRQEKASSASASALNGGKPNHSTATTRTASGITNSSSTALTHAKCCICRCPWTTYRGKFKCQMPDCGVPVLVCDACAVSVSQQKQQQRTRTKISSNGERPRWWRSGWCRFREARHRRGLGHRR